MRSQKLNTDREEFNKLSPKNKLEHLIKFGALAPSSHNTQPWLFKLYVNENLIEVMYDPKRHLLVSDPSGRQMYLSIGAATENIVQAAKHFGWKTDVQLILKSELVAKISFSQQADLADDDLIEAILTRHNNRFPFKEQQLTDQFNNWLNKQSNAQITVFNVSTNVELAKISNIVERALEVALDDHNFRQELSHWVKPSSKKYRDGMPGYNLGMPKLISYLFPTMLRKMKMGKTQRKMESKSLRKTPTFCILGTQNDNKQNWFECGRLFENIALHAERAGIKIGVLAAAIEMPGFEKELAEVLHSNMRPLMFLRMGYTEKIPIPSPRLDDQEIIKS